MIEKLAKIYSRFFTIEAIMWEVEPMLASGHFQDQITPPSETDIVVLIVWSRLGTPLPRETSTRAYRGYDGRVPVTGTEWEFEDALAAQKVRGAPDLLAYRKQVEPTVSLRDRAAKAAAEDQWEKLNGFWNRWFVNRGEFRAAFVEFSDLDTFENRLERDLSKLIQQRIEFLRGSGATTGGAPSWLTGSPFRGLEAYHFEHSQIFFGRTAWSRAAVEQLTGNAQAGRAFLLVLGASGAGKSSLVQAGVLPALAARGVVPTVGLWRRSVMRPTGHPDGPFAALAQALVGQAALPELLGGSQSIESLARHLRAAADDPAFPLVAVLNTAEQQARAQGELLAIENANLALVVDQLEELFTADLSSNERVAFIRCLSGLAKAGRVFVVATMRSDYWHRAAETPLLVDMAAGQGRLDLLVPVQDEIMEMIRQPAHAAGLDFDNDPTRQIRLDATLASEAASEPGALPLLSFLLDELYKSDVEQGGQTTLTYTSMMALGGLRGAIAARAETVFMALTPAAQAALPKVLRALVTVSSSGTAPTSRAVPLAVFESDLWARELINGLLQPQARLLVTEGSEESAQLRVAHEALISHWQRAKQQIKQDRDDLRVRAMIELAYAEWRAASKRERPGLLLRDPQLGNAIDLTKRWATDVDGAIAAFVDMSRRRARLVQQLTIGAAAVFAVIALTASVLGFVAYQERTRADQAYRLAQNQLRDWQSWAMDLEARLEKIRLKDLDDRITRAELYDVVRNWIRSQASSFNELSGTSVPWPERARREARFLIQLSDGLEAEGELNEARNKALSAITSLRELMDRDPSHPTISLLADGLLSLSSVDFAAGDTTAAIAALREAIPLLQNVEDEFRLRIALETVSSYYEELRQYDMAILFYEEALKLQRKNVGQESVARILIRLGDLHLSAGDESGADAAFRESFDLNQSIDRKHSVGWHRNMVLYYERINDRQRALDEYEMGLAIARSGYDSDKSVFTQPKHADVFSVLEEVGRLQLAVGNQDAAFAVFSERLTLARKGARKNPHDQQKLSSALSDVGNILRSKRDSEGALIAYNAALRIRQKWSSPQNFRQQMEIVSCLADISSVSSVPNSRAALREAYEIVEPLTKDKNLAPALHNWPARLESALSELH